jgi:hypothetical protein
VNRPVPAASSTATAQRSAGAAARPQTGSLTVTMAGRAILVCMSEHVHGDEAAMYNYRNFDAWVEALGDVAGEVAFAASPSAGQRAPDFTVPRLGDGALVSLSELWRSKPLVMEFGSFT